MISRFIAVLFIVVSPVFAGITIIPHVPTAAELAAELAGSGLSATNGELVVTNAGGAIVVAPGTNSVPITNANPAQLIITAPTNILAVHTIDTNGNSVIAFSATSDIPGPQGAPGAGNLQFYGNWVTNTPYGTNIIAVYGGQAYYTTRGVTSPTPPSADTTNWAIFAQAGSDGSNGTSGTNGLDGAGLVYRGTWAGGNLTTNDIVSYLGTSYVPLRNLTPSDQPDTSTNYVVFVARGTDGASGNVVSNLFFLGDWVISTVYPSNSVVGYGGRVYYANKTASNYVTLAPSINSDFTLLIDEGADGTDGDDGLNGVSLVYDNCYDASKVYVSNVVVTYPCTGKKNLYRATGAGGPVVGVTPPSDASKWEEIISSGADADVQTFAFYSSYTTNIVYSNAWVKYVNGTVYYSLSTVPAGAGPLDTNYWAVVVTNGANGAAGASGTNGMNGLNGSAGPTNMQFMGSWVGGTFTTNQLVTWSGVTYFVNTASTTSRPPASGWDVFVDRGPEGPQGTNYTTYYTNVITYVYLTNQIVTNISYVTNTFNYTNVAYTSIITVVTNTYTATNVYASVEAYSDSVNGLRTSPSNSSVLQYCLTNGTSSGGISGPYVSPSSNNPYASDTTQTFANAKSLAFQIGRTGTNSSPGYPWELPDLGGGGLLIVGGDGSNTGSGVIQVMDDNWAGNPYPSGPGGMDNHRMIGRMSGRSSNGGGMSFMGFSGGYQDPGASLDAVTYDAAMPTYPLTQVAMGKNGASLTHLAASDIAFGVVDYGSGNSFFDVMGDGTLYVKGGGGLRVGSNSTVTAGSFGTVAGGNFNTSTGSYATVSGGNGNQALGWYSSIGGGETNWALGQHSHVGGGYGNYIDLSTGAVIGGGKSNVVGSTGVADYSFVGGGVGNRIRQATNAVIAGGSVNNIQSGANNSFIGGGTFHSIGPAFSYSTIAGGYNNAASNQYAAIGGGSANHVTGIAGTVPGGSANVAAGGYSFAAGVGARALHNGSFVWSDSRTYAGILFDSTATNQFLINATGGVGINTNAPTQALQVNGNVQVSGTATNGYQFPSLSRLYDDGTNLFYRNSTGGVAQITSM